MLGMMGALLCRLIALLLAVLAPSLIACDHVIDDYGAIRNNASAHAADLNGIALYKALLAAAGGSNGSRTAVVPRGGEYYFRPYADFDGISNVLLSLDGALLAYTEGLDSAWPGCGSGRHGCLSAIQFNNCDNVTVRGGGVIDGRGYDWWWHVILNHTDHRPNLFGMDLCSNVVIRGISLLNSPQFHMFLNVSAFPAPPPPHLTIAQVRHALVEGVTVWVDVEKQKSLLAAGNRLSDGANGMPRGIPTFPLNTDGIDVKGQNITVRNCTITNFDDAVCLKPTDGSAAAPFSNCTEDVLVQDVDIHFGVGASVGSVPPHANVNCIRNIKFLGLRFHSALKGIYVKPNPGSGGQGIIHNITYENIYGRDTVWWSLWVSTQQQHQPGGSSTGCSFLFPVEGSCPTDPFVPVTNLHLKNVTLLDGLFSPGVLRCNASGPCTGWLFEDVIVTSVTHWPVKNGFLCEGIRNSSWSSVVPNLSLCFDADGG